MATETLGKGLYKICITYKIKVVIFEISLNDNMV